MAQSIVQRFISHPLRRVARQVPLVSSALGRVCEPSVDAFIVSFPKCGRTWLRVQIGRALQQHFGLNVEDVVTIEDMADLDPRVPRIRMLHADKPQRKRPEELRPAVVEYFRHRKVVFLIRDPRDVVVSLYMQRTKRGMQPFFSGSLAEFLDEPIGSFDTMMRYYSLWAERGPVEPNLLIVRYEDMHADPVRELRRVLDFVGLVDVDDAVVEEAARFSSFDRMREMERKGEVQNKKLRPGDPSDEQSFKTRKGRVGGYREELGADQVNVLQQRMRDSLSAFYVDVTAE
jgi:hypothetical protein